MSVPVTEDVLVEGTETVNAQITISDPTTNTQASIGSGDASANITDDDTALSATLSATAGAENNAGTPVAIVYTVTLDNTNNTGGVLIFDIADLATGSATSGTDYTAFPAGATITVANGATTGTLSVPVTEDVLVEGTETVNAQITISDPTTNTQASMAAAMRRRISPMTIPR